MFTVLVVKGGTSNNIWEKAQRDYSALNDAIWELRIIVSRHCRWTCNEYLRYIVCSWKCKFKTTNLDQLSQNRVANYWAFSYISQYNWSLSPLPETRTSLKLVLFWFIYYRKFPNQRLVKCSQSAAAVLVLKSFSIFCLV